MNIVQEQARPGWLAGWRKVVEGKAAARKQGWVREWRGWATLGGLRVTLGAKRGRLARFCVEEGCYWHGGCRVVGHLGLHPLLRSESLSVPSSIPPFPVYLSHPNLLLAHTTHERTFRLARVQDILVSPLCRVTFGLYARPNLPDRRPGPPFSTNPGDELRGSRGLLVAMATEPSSPNPRRPNTGSCPSVHTSLFVSRCLFASSSNHFLHYDFSFSPRGSISATSLL